MSNRNIYAAARNAAGLTQERAAECLAISVRSLADYESGVRLPSEEVAVQMVDVYHAQYLAYQHLRARSDLGRRLIPEVAADKLPQAVLELIDKIYDFADEHEETNYADKTALQPPQRGAAAAVHYRDPAFDHRLSALADHSAGQRDRGAQDGGGGDRPAAAGHGQQ